jgi:hypothetical protein
MNTLILPSAYNAICKAMILSKVNVIMLDESVETFEFDPRSGSGGDLLAMVCQRLVLYEMDYFGFTIEESTVVRPPGKKGMDHVQSGRLPDEGTKIVWIWYFSTFSVNVAEEDGIMWDVRC